MTPPEPTITGDFTVSIDGEQVGSARNLTFDGLDHLDDPDGLLDEDDPVVQATPVDLRPEATQKEVTVALLKELAADEWNAMVNAMREEETDWSADLSDEYFYEVDLSERDLRLANFTAATLDHAYMTGCQLQGATFTRASLYNTRFTRADVTGSNYKDAISWEDARWTGAVGYTPPLVDCTEAVARHYLVEAINDPDSIVNDGLRMLVDNGFNAEWRGSNLHFWMAHQMQRFIDKCEDEDEECYCETEHECGGDCSCCACYTGNCDCEPDHQHEIEETDQFYLATVIGHVYFEWNSVHGLRGNISMDRHTQHPHVSTNSTACWGDAEMPDTLCVADYLLMVTGWIGQHNPSSEYRPITDLPRVA